QQRPNMFTNSVANIGPGETVMIAIEYQMPLKQARGLFSLRLPLVVGPRYVPPHSIVTNADAVDVSKVTAAPILDPKTSAKINPVSITVHLNPGFVPANISSANHKVAVTGKGDQRMIQLAKGTVPADRDFELSWQSASADPTVALYREQVGDKGYVMASITPPVDDQKSFVPPRDMIFVIDNSGSMSGTSMDQAKLSLLNALKTLRPQDHFNVIRFDDTMTKLFPASVAASEARVAEAMAYTQSLQATGGTEMLPALIAALAHDEKANVTKAVRQIIFLTDGAISNEKEMIAAIGADKGRSHIFLVGIGSAPNNYLMSRMANMGRGSYTNIGSTAEVTAKMASLIDVLSRPSVQNLSVKVSGNSFDLTPRMLPDLYAGEPLLLLGQADKLEGTLTVSGRIGEKLWSQTVDLKSATDSPSVAKLWARRRIDDVEADLALGILDSKAADAAITDLGLTYGLVTSQTSLVAIDETPTRPVGQMLKEEELPINLPDGWDFDTLFGGEAAAMATANAEDKATLKATQEVTAIDLPQTATNFAVLILKGLFLFLVGAKGLFALRLKRTSSK
ncbi:MAG: marine proteobacterial sortase target protein, partial [Chakrabartia sp.]